MFHLSISKVKSTLDLKCALPLFLRHMSLNIINIMKLSLSLNQTLFPIEATITALRSSYILRVLFMFGPCILIFFIFAFYSTPYLSTNELFSALVRILSNLPCQNQKGETNCSLIFFTVFSKVQWQRHNMSYNPPGLQLQSHSPSQPSL